jgi:hypothetical protein
MNDINIAVNLPTIIFLTITLLVTGVCLFLIGYFIGKQSSTGVSNTMATTKPTSFFDNNTEQKSKAITIDNSKFVTDIRTDNLEKKYTQLGEIKKSEENISDSINKLKNMKK